MMVSLPVACSSLIAATAILSLTGCGDIERALNRGGDTPCQEYVGQDPDTKRMTITKFIKQRQHTDAEPSGTAVDASIIAVDLLCRGQRNTDTPIKQADLAGVLLP